MVTMTNLVRDNTDETEVTLHRASDLQTIASTGKDIGALALRTNVTIEGQTEMGRVLTVDTDHETAHEIEDDLSLLLLSGERGPTVSQYHDRHLHANLVHLFHRRMRGSEAM